LDERMMVIDLAVCLAVSAIIIWLFQR